MSTPRRSVSPFGQIPQQEQSFTVLESAIQQAFPEGSPEAKPAWQQLADMASVPAIMRQIAEAPANDAGPLNLLCNFLVRYNVDLEVKGLDETVFSAMQELFNKKTEVFLVTHYDREACEKMGWPDPSRDVALFSRERDALVGYYFAPVTEKNPGRFSEFINHWVETDNLDRLLHFLDFCRESKNPTFEHYLIFSHPALQRLLRNKTQMRALHTKALPLIVKLTSNSGDLWSLS